MEDEKDPPHEAAVSTDRLEEEEEEEEEEVDHTAGADVLSSHVDLVDDVAAPKVHPVVNSTTRLDPEGEAPTMRNVLSPQEEEDHDAKSDSFLVSTTDLNDDVNTSKQEDSLDVTADDSIVMASTLLYGDALMADNAAKENPDRHTMMIPQPPVPSTSVTAERKEQLLLEARLDRLHWLQQVPLPYRYESSSVLLPSTEIAASPEEVQQFVKLSHVTYHVPSVLPVLQHLYGNDVPLLERMETVLGSALKEHESSKRHLLTGDQIYAHALQRLTDDDDTKAILMAHHALLQLLPDPTLSVTVQGMRNFVRTLQQTPPSDATTAAKFHAYLHSIVDALQHHALYQTQFVPFVETNPVFLQSNVEPHVWLRRSVESFVFGQCAAYWEDAILTPVAQEAAFQEKLAMLQFITPDHLDIHCFQTTTTDPHLPAHEAIRLRLANAITALQSMDAYYSAYEKLQRILRVYKEINTALTAALAHSSSVEKLPSADDILPTFILVILYARPQRLYFNLQFLEQLALPEYLRGEAGYAYTNLYGAYQFLQDLDLSQEPLSLSISPEALQEALCTYKQHAAEQQYPALHPSPAAAVTTATVDTYRPMATEDWETSIATTAAPTPLEIRRARLRGEVVNLDWAVQWQQERSRTSIPTVAPSPMHHRKSSSRSVLETAEDGLPSGFRRNYNFLTVRSPDDIRYSDIAPLLKEYHMLVRTTETLLSERAMKVSADRKAQRRAREQRLVTSAQSFDTADLL